MAQSPEEPRVPLARRGRDGRRDPEGHREQRLGGLQLRSGVRGEAAEAETAPR